MKDLTSYRKSYEKSELGDEGLPADPMQLFKTWFSEAEHANEAANEVNAMSIATLSPDGFPKTRIVLLKQYTQEAFLFFTNYNSEKGRAIANNPNVCLSFFWPWMERQVIIKGIASKTSESASDEYFYTRPKGSQIGAVVSNQSEVIASRRVIEDKLRLLEEQYAEVQVPRPEEWGGYTVQPQQMEFWQGRPNRLHDRILYSKLATNWKQERLSP